MRCDQQQGLIGSTEAPQRLAGSLPGLRGESAQPPATTAWHAIEQHLFQPQTVRPALIDDTAPGLGPVRRGPT